MGKTLYQKVWDAHKVGILPDGRTQLFIATHFMHEVTSPQAFGMLRDLGLKVIHPERTFATVDHIIPTDDQSEPLADERAEAMLREIRKNCAENGIRMFDMPSGLQGIVHMVGPELGITQPGMTIVCGDSHTATHGAFGSIAMGIGTTQVRDVLATQTLAQTPLKVRNVRVEGKLRPGVTAKDVALHIIGLLGANGGLGYAYEFGGSTIDAMSMDERLTLCNLAIEGAARCGYINPDETTFEYIKGRLFAPTGQAWDEAVARWKSFASDPDAVYDDIVTISAEDIAPTVTWGISPDQNIGIDQTVPSPDDAANADTRKATVEALQYMKLEPGSRIKGLPVQVCFIGSCTNGRISDFRTVAHYIKGRKVAPGIKALAVPGSQMTAKQCEEEGIADIFREAGFEWRLAGCSMCLAMNPDKLVGDQVCASSSNRNFKGRQGSPTGRTLLMSPVMVAAAALTGRISDAREVFNIR
ncbi:3-isopropylmalate dehydratase large subunit [Akkermansia glycaniphila]|uniref:3-isopropylmalate dehydratase large subunit n=1 Tax=Akkermansia glycaniphila TaxID=1679444 RepID=UPI001C031C9D|nr:3-isopropylmalate dehydratase large subunit [Akkermansia glycaniphila]MBT9450442.1 3-isopropylmalate dehydratase large subunit [Akkermansia glycaniphila]